MTTKYRKQDAKDYAREHFRGVWAATSTPFNDDLSFNAEGFRSNLRHWIQVLKLGGLFVAGKQGEFFSLSVDGAQAADRAVGRGGLQCRGTATAHGPLRHRDLVLRHQPGRGAGPGAATRRTIGADYVDGAQPGAALRRGRSDETRCTSTTAT
jgi:hypothetical protein